MSTSCSTRCSLVADVEIAEELVANPKKPAVAAVLESHLDQGRGPVVSALVEEGTLRVGDTIVAGPAWGRVRAMFDESGQAVTEAGPSVPVEVLGLDDVPMAGDELRVAPNDKVARTVAEARAAPPQGRGVAQPDDARAAAPASKTCSRRCSAARSPR